MPRNATVKVVNTFTKGLVTEATGFNFPDDAATDCLNVKFNNLGEVTTRKGFNYENDFAVYSVDADSRVVKEYLWENAAGNVNYNFVVMQLGATLHFYLVSSTNALSEQKKFFTVDLNSYKTSGSPSVSNTEASFATGLNYLFVAHPYIDPIYIKYDPDSDSLTVRQVTVKIRDFEGIDDDLDIDERPSTLSSNHKYNIRNQGWYQRVRTDSSNNADPVTTWFDSAGVYPSNADIWWLYKNAEDEFDPGNRNSIARGNTQANKGHYILKAFYQDRSAVAGIGNYPIVSSSYYRPSVVTFFAGRVWYAGVNHTKFTNKIYFSQIIERDDQIGLCYQMNDPTSEDAFDLLPTDGGVVVIPDMGTVYKLVNIQSSLLVFTSTGIWSVSGSEGLGFRANDYTVRKISSVPSISSSSFADIEGFAIWWNLDGIYIIATDNVGNFQVESITDTTIKAFVDNIPAQSKRYVKGCYNRQDKVIQFLYRSTEEDGISNRYFYDRVLVFDTLIKAFYPLSLPTDGIGILGIVSTQGAGSIEIDATVTDSGGNTVTASSITVTVDRVETTAVSSVFKYIVYSDTLNGITFAEEYDESYRDFTTLPYTVYVDAGYAVDGQAVTKLQSNYVTVLMKELANSSCYLQGRFDWSNHSSSGKWSTRQQCYRDTPYFGVKRSRLKVRGSGRAIQLRFTGETGKPFTIIGWSIFETANGSP